MRGAAWVVLAAWSVMLLGWLTLHWGILPHIDEWRPHIEQRASATIGQTLRIGRIEVRSSGWVPTLELSDLRLLDREGRDALRLERVVAAVSPRSLWSLQLRFDQLLIEGARLDVRRDAAGHLHVGGLDMSAGSGASDTSGLDWFFDQHEFAIRNGTLRWTDEQRQAPPLELTAVDLVVRNGLRHHHLRLDATPPQAWGDRFSLRGRFTQPLLARKGDWRRWSGALYLDLPYADVAELRRHVTLPFEWSAGEGALRAWLEIVRGTPRQAHVDVALHAVAMQLAAPLDVLSLDRLQARLAAERDAQGMRLAAEQLEFTTADGLRWPGGVLKLALKQKQDLERNEFAGHPVTAGEFSADRLDLDLMARVGSRLPLGDAIGRWFAELKPRGVLSGLSARWEGPLDAPQRYEVRTRLSGLALAAASAASSPDIGRPGLRQADLELNATEKGGDAKLTIVDGALEFPGVFADPVLPLQKLSAQLAWRIVPSKQPAAPPAVELKVRDARFANHDAQGELNATWSTGPGSGVARGGRFPGQLDLSGKLTRGNAASVWRYLPLGIPASVRDYVRRAVVSGQLPTVAFKARGDLWSFPFTRPGDGDFTIGARVQDLVFAYLPTVPPGEAEPPWTSPWPAFSRVHGELLFDRLSMQLRDVQAQVGGIELHNVHGGIANLAERQVLAIEGQGRGALADMLGFVHQTPVGDWTGQELRPIQATGAAELRLALNMPLGDPSQASVRGSVVLPGNDLRIRPQTPLLAGARGRVDFTQRGFTIVGAGARVLGGDASFDGGTQPDGSLRFNGQGVASAEALRRAPELGALARLASVLQGQAAYRVGLGFVRGWPEIHVTSNLVGMSAELPAPLRKAAEASWPLRYQTALLPESLARGATPRDTLRFELANVVQAQFVRDLGGDAPAVLRGGIGVLDTLPDPPSGVHANVSVPVLDLDAWQATAQRLGFDADAPGPAAPAERGYVPQTVALRTAELVAGARRITRLTAGLSQQDTPAERVWRANVDADQLAGHLEWRQPRDAAAAGKVMARLSRMSLPPSEAASVEDMLGNAPSSVPALDIVVDRFELRGKQLGRVEIAALNRGDARPGQREWQLDKLNFTTPEARLAAQGRWAPGSAGSRGRMVMDFKLDLADGGAFVERLGAGRALRGGKGQMQGQLSWAGSPLSVDYPSLDGRLSVALDAGQFLHAEPGAARLLGVLSLQALPRRLLLDFRDVFQEGFAFDNVTGDVRIAQGVASTNNLRMRGVQAVVLMEGKADLQRETQDLQVLIVPEINAGTASLAYAAINPAVGLGTFLAQLVLRRPLMLAGTRQFHVTGPWGEPKVERVVRSIDAPGAASAPAKESAPVRPPPAKESAG